MKVRDFIKWLETQDQDATVNVMVQQKAPTWESYGPCEETPFTPDLSEYRDMRGNPFAKGQPYENDRTLVLGQKD